MIFNYSKIAHSATQPKARSGVSLFLYDDTDKIEAVLEKPLSIEWRGNEIIVPTDSYTDFASCPRILWNIFAPIGRHTKAAIIHDYLYTTKAYPRKDADYVFRELMRESKVGFLKRWLMWAAVRMFGGGHW